MRVIEPRDKNIYMYNAYQLVPRSDRSEAEWKNVGERRAETRAFSTYKPQSPRALFSCTIYSPRALARIRNARRFRDFWVTDKHVPRVSPASPPRSDQVIGRLLKFDVLAETLERATLVRGEKSRGTGSETDMQF